MDAGTMFLGDPCGRQHHEGLSGIAIDANFPIGHGKYSISQREVTEHVVARSIMGFGDQVGDFRYCLPKGILAVVHMIRGVALPRDLRIPPIVPGEVCLFVGPIDTEMRIGRGPFHSEAVFFNQAEYSGVIADDRFAECRSGRGKCLISTTKAIENQFGIASFEKLMRSAVEAAGTCCATLLTMAAAAPEVRARHQLVDPSIADGTDFSRLVQEVCEYPNHSWTNKLAAKLVGYSEFHFSRHFRTVLGVGFPDFLERCRCQNALTHLALSSDSVEQIADSTGFKRVARLRTALRKQIGFLPHEIRQWRNSH